jgi:hypothetical protein
MSEPIALMVEEALAQKAVVEKTVIGNRGRKKRPRLPSGKSVREIAEDYREKRLITGRDYALLEALYKEYPIMSLTNIAKMFWPESKSPRAVQRRLSMLWERHVVDRIHGYEDAMVAKSIAPTYVYSLSSVGAELLSIKWAIPEGRRGLPYQPRNYTNSRHFVMHDLTLVEMSMRLREALPEPYRLVWINEPRAALWQDGKVVLMPDAAFVVANVQTKQKLGLFLVEFTTQQGGANFDYWKKKTEMYLKANTMYSKAWREKYGGDDVPVTVLAVVDSDVPAILKQSARIIGNAQKPHRWLFKPWAAVVSNDPLGNWVDTDLKKAANLLEGKTHEEKPT